MSKEIPPRRQLLSLINDLSRRHSAWQVFADFVELAALSVSNAVDLSQRTAREERYLQLIKGYDKDEAQRFPEMLAALVLALEQDPSDVLGTVFHDLELHNKYRGQFFTPYHLCSMMAEMSMGSNAELQAHIDRTGFVTVSEPACGAGAMIIAFAEVMKAKGYSPHSCLHVTAVDIDSRAAYMAYLQFSLLHIPAVVIVGNTISLEEREHWFTPAHILHNWNMRLAMRSDDAAAPVRLPEAPVQLGMFEAAA